MKPRKHRPERASERAEIHQERKKHPALDRQAREHQVYLQHLNANKKRIAVYLFQYCKWANKTPEELLSLKNCFESSDAEKLLDRFTISPTEFPDSLKWNMINAVKAFYRTNYRQLQSAAGHFEYVTKKAQNAPSKQTRRALFKACYTPWDRLSYGVNVHGYSERNNVRVTVEPF